MVALATVSPAGSTSVRAAFRTAVVVFPLPRVIVNALVAPVAIVAGAKDSATVGAMGAVCPITTAGAHAAITNNALRKILIYVTPPIRA
jgi:hypothetical protein